MYMAQNALSIHRHTEHSRARRRSFEFLERGQWIVDVVVKVDLLKS